MDETPLLPVPGLEGDEEGTRVVREELRLLAVVQAALDAAQKRGTEATEDDARLLELRDDVAVAKPEDLPALFEQMHTLGAYRGLKPTSSDPDKGRYDYEAAFDKGTMLVELRLDPTQKIGAYRVVPQSNSAATR